MTASVITGLAATVSVNDGVSNAAQTFSTATNITLPFGDVKTIEYSTLGQADRYIKKIEGMIEPGNLTFEIIYSHADYVRLDALKGIFKSWVVIVPTDTVATTTASFSGAVVKADADLKNDAIVMVKVEVAISGAIVLS